MNVNATLVVQAVNFIITYFALRVFLFKPSVMIIDQEQKKHDSIENIIAQQKQSITLKEKERQKNWHICRLYFRKNRPAVDTVFIFKGLTPEVKPYEIKEGVITNLINQTKQAIEQKVGHVLE